MPLPAPLLRNNPNVHKNNFGHVLILAGSGNMLGAPCLCGLAAMRAGAGLVTIGVPKTLNLTLQKKISPSIMTMALPGTPQATLSSRAYNSIKGSLTKFQAIAIGPGLTQNTSTQKLIRKITQTARQPLVIDADGLNAVARDLKCLCASSTVKVLTPHPGEMSRLTALGAKKILKDPACIARQFAQEYNVILLLKGHHTVVAGPDGRIYINKTGNAGMATAGSGDVLTGMIAALLAQGLSGFEAARWGAYLHGKAGDLAASAKTRAGMIATDIIDNIPKAIKECDRRT